MGTGDGGATIKGNDLVLLQRMESAAKVLNLKEHVVGLTKLHGAADIVSFACSICFSFYFERRDISLQRTNVGI